MTYKNDNPDHAFQADLVHEQQSFEMNFREATASSFFSNSTNFKELSLAGIQNTDSGNSNEKLESFLARITILFTINIYSQHLLELMGLVNLMKIIGGEHSPLDL